MINERHSIKNAEAINILFPEINISNTQLSLIYEASEELHNINIKERIMSFLIIKDALDITVYVNSSIYFKMADFNRTKFVELEDEFRKYVTKLETKETGKIFWIFSQIAHYTPNEEEIKREKKRVAMIGKGNRTLKDNFEVEVEEYRETYRKQTTKS